MSDIRHKLEQLPKEALIELIEKHQFTGAFIDERTIDDVEYLTDEQKVDITKMHLYLGSDGRFEEEEMMDDTWSRPFHKAWTSIYREYVRYYPMKDFQTIWIAIHMYFEEGIRTVAERIRDFEQNSYQVSVSIEETLDLGKLDPLL